MRRWNPGRSTFTVGSRSTTISSEALRGNPLGDPTERPLWVYLPPGTTTTRTPVRLGLRDPGTDRSARHVAEPVPVPPELPGAGRRPLRARRGAARDRRLGRLLDLARREPVPRFAGDRQVPDLPLRRGRALRRRALPDARRPLPPGIQGSRAAATAPWSCRCCDRTSGRAGDARRRCPLRDVLPAGVPRAVRTLRDEYGGSFESFWKDFRSRPAFAKESDGLLLNDWCMAACYSADPDGTVRLPFDPATGELIPSLGPVAPWNRCAWCRIMPTTCARSARSTSMPGRRTSISSTWERRRSVMRSKGSA